MPVLVDNSLYTLTLAYILCRDILAGKKKKSCSVFEFLLYYGNKSLLKSSPALSVLSLSFFLENVVLLNP